MDWDKSIERYELPLLRIVGALFALLVSSRLSGSGLMVPRHVWRSILFVLRPAEAAVRRLIIIAARTIVLSPSPLRGSEGRARPVARPGKVRGGGATSSAANPDAFSVAPVFRLFDPLKRFDFSFDDGGSFSDGSATVREDVPDDTPVNAVPLHYRLRALRNALADLPKQAARLARFNARRDALLKAGRAVRTSLIRPGLPPGWRERPKHEVDTVLKECHRLVRHLEDTS